MARVMGPSQRPLFGPPIPTRIPWAVSTRLHAPRGRLPAISTSRSYRCPMRVKSCLV
jgi:hypothetical protein